MHWPIPSVVKATTVVTSGVALGLFASRLLGELVPDSIAAAFCMFVAGGLSCGFVGLVVGYAWGRNPRH